MKYYIHGCEIKELKEERKDESKMKLFYVGGISEELYDFEKVFIAVNQMENVELTICCREKEWEKLKNKYNKYINKNIKIIHITGKELEDYYRRVDICIMIFKENPYMQMAMPVKLFEYLQNNKPIIATSGTMAGQFIEENNIGINVKYDVNEIKKILETLKNDRKRIEDIKCNQKEVIKNNTWTCRAKKVSCDLY